jgi:uncharacterized membrane protein YagU involved in acid resistance
MTASRRGGWPHALAGGAVAGALDIGYACAFWAIKAGVPPRRILQSVAAGLLGRDAAVAGGAATAALGLGLHFVIALTMAAVYFVMARRWALLWQRAWLMGALYGLWLYIAMNYIVVPLSAAGGGGRQDPVWVTVSVVVHIVLVGIPCAIGARFGIVRERAATAAVTRS